MYKVYVLLLLLLCTSSRLNAQILFSESFTVILDSNVTKKGSIVPNLKFQTQKKDLLEISNTADFTIRSKKRALTFANQIEFQKYGTESILSGGYLYTEFRNVFEKLISIEYFAQAHWAEARGMKEKFSGGLRARFRLVNTSSMGLFLGIGPFYEYELWTYKGVEDHLLPIDLSPKINENLKIGSYISYKHQVLEKLKLDISVYHQSRFDEFFISPRVATSSSFKYKLSKHLDLIFLYQNIYDFKPIVPIRNWFHRYVTSISISF